MNGITINDKQYIFLETDEDCGMCGKCDLYKDKVCKSVEICSYFYSSLHSCIGYGVFKKLKEEK